TRPGAADTPDTPRGARARGTRGAAGEGPTSQPSEEKPPITTDHQVTIDGQPIKYKATAGTLPLRDDQNRTRAHIFFVAYERSDVSDAEKSNRPVTFVFNGGPGAASIWLHMGTAGPKRVAIADDGSLPSPPYRLSDNSSSWLDITDLVFIDPVGTGYSRAEGDRAREF
ncbi:MAG: S10 family serine carboxypeptidase-like protein, partial [Tepidisphaeraceae bacterium]